MIVDDLKHWFSRSLRRRRELQHFGRHSLVDTLAAQGPTEAVPADLAKNRMQASCEDTPTSTARLESRETGLPAGGSTRRLARNGSNEVTHEKPLPFGCTCAIATRTPSTGCSPPWQRCHGWPRMPRQWIVVDAMVLLSTLMKRHYIR
jgi:hypothetical protein